MSNNEKNQLYASKVNWYAVPTDDVSKSLGAIYLFPHYRIVSSKYRIEPDREDTDMLDISDICTHHNELFTILIDKKDMSCQGFKMFILDTLDNMLHAVNECKIPKTIDPENYLSYRQLMTIICFINKYNEYLHILPYRFKYVLVHILDDNNDECGYYYRYNIATIAENGEVIGDIMNCHLIEKSEVGKTSDYDYRNDNPEYKYEVAMNFITKMSDKIDYKIAYGHKVVGRQTLYLSPPAIF